MQVKETIGKDRERSSQKVLIPPTYAESPRIEKSCHSLIKKFGEFAKSRSFDISE